MHVCILVDNVGQMDKLASLPSDAAERLLSMQATIDQLSAELNKVSQMEEERPIGTVFTSFCPFSFFFYAVHSSTHWLLLDWMLADWRSLVLN